MNHNSMASRRKIKEENVKQNASGDFIGVAYYYRNKHTGLYYCGATVKESTRKSAFKNVNCSYGGKKIDKARAEFSNWDQDWEYTPIKITAHTIDELITALDYTESYLIAFYDSYRTGYNSNQGGLGRSSRSRILVIEKDGTKRVFNSCEDVARTYTMSPGNVYHYVYKVESHTKKNGMIFLPIDDSTTMSALPPTFLTTFSITLP